MRVLGASLLWGGLAGLMLPALAVAADFPGASGMAPLNDHSYLCVQDVKDKPENEGKARFGALIVFTPEERKEFPGLGMLSYTPLSWCYGANVDCCEDFPSDLEAVCAVPGHPGEYYASESGYWGSRYGRLFHLVTHAGEHETWSVTIDQVLHLPHFADQVEGIACAATEDGRLLLILGERGGMGDEGSSGQLHWGWIDGLEAAQDGNAPANWQYDSMEVSNPHALAYPTARSVGDLYLDDSGNLWAASAYDPDADYGPFASGVRAVANVDPDSDYPVTAEDLAGDSWLVEGMKIEAIASGCTPDSSICFATDDEGYGGVWRPLGVPTDLNGDGTSVDSGAVEDTADDPSPTNEH
jgi:hypothetical protein